MNLYARYFNQDVLVHSFDELMAFLSSIPEIPVNQRMTDELRAYVDSDMPYPKRYKIRPRVYFILIKTTAQTMEEFKAHRKNADAPAPPAQTYTAPPPAADPVVSRKEMRAAELREEHLGWYLGTISFKRVLPIVSTGKFCYQDTTFQAYVFARSGAECYDRIIDHLKGRTDVDPRSQFPSARGNNFNFEYMGETLEEN